MEIWKPVKDFEGWYEVSNLGRVRSVERYIKHSCGKVQKNPSKIKIPQKHIPNRGKTIYYHVQLFKNSKHYKRWIHRLVAESFIPNPDGKPTVNHKDGNGMNNHVDNLEWATRSEQAIHASNVLKWRCKPIRCITPEGAVIEFPSTIQASVVLGIHRTGITNVLAGRSKTYKKFRFEFI